MSLRLACVEDAPACAAIVSRWLMQTAWLPAQPAEADLSEMIAQGIPMRELWVIGAPVAGYLSFDVEDRLIAGLYTALPGSGHGKALVDAVKEGRDFIHLWTHEPNVQAHRFYHREGFVTVERNAEGRGDGVPELRMEWRA